MKRSPDNGKWYIPASSSCVVWVIALVAGLIIGYYGLPRYLDADVDRALEIIAEGRASHVFESDYEPLAGTEFHERWVQNYNYLEAVVRRVK